MNKTTLLTEAWTRLTEAGSYVLACHQNPDGDAIGSALALAHALRALGKDVTVVCDGGVPDNYKFLPEHETVLATTDRRGFDIGMLVDCEGIKRSGTSQDAVASGKTKACIDHHVPDDAFGDIRLVDPSSSSTAELIVRLFEANGVEIDSVMATQLMAGLVNDTGGFRFRNTTPTTLRTAARLMELGADVSSVAREIYESRTFTSSKLLERALNSLETDKNGHVVWATITRKDMDELGASDADTDSIVNHVGYVKGPKVAVLFREAKPASIRISLRSRDGVDVNQIARVFGGGGHKAAAGCTVELPLDEAKIAVIAEVLKWTES